MSNRLIVESKNDKIFMQSLVNYLNKNNVDIAAIKIAENAYLPLGGSDSTKIKNELRKIKDEAQKNPINKIGMVPRACHQLGKLEEEKCEKQNINRDDSPPICAER